MSQQDGQIPLDVGWDLSGEGTRIEDFLGVRALRLRTGMAVRRDISLQNGTIEFDMAVTPHRSFVYVLFRMVTDDEYEEVYFRPHKSELPDAIQYGPVWRGESNWQLYHGRGGTAPVTFAHREWIHVRLVLSGRRASLFVGEANNKPHLVIQLAREPESGYLAFRALTPAGAAPTGEFAAAIANVVVKPEHVPLDIGHEGSANAPPPGLVTQWQISPAVTVAPGPVIRVPDGLLASKGSWPSFPVEPTGVLVIGRHVARPARQSAVVARLVLRASGEHRQRLRLGYSDFVTVFVNGQPLFAGDAHYSFDEPRQDGVIGLWQATVWLPLRRGENEVLLVVSDSFGGWGLTGQLDPSDGAEVVAPAR
ncbi:MAG: hypothetical protein ACRDGN_00860 [bacterium]